MSNEELVDQKQRLEETLDRGVDEKDLLPAAMMLANAMGEGVMPGYVSAAQVQRFSEELRVAVQKRAVPLSFPIGQAAQLLRKLLVVEMELAHHRSADR